MQHSRMRTTVTLLALLSVVVLAMALSVGMPHAAHAATAFDPLSVGALALGMTAPAAPGIGGSPFFGLIPDELVGRRKRSFMAPIDWAPIAAGSGGAPGEYKSDNNHDFIVHRLAYVARDAAGAIVVSPRLLAELSLSGNILLTPSGVPIDLEGLAGLAGRQTPDLVIPIVIPASETLTVLLRNPGAAALYVQLLLIGFRSERASR